VAVEAALELSPQWVDSASLGKARRLGTHGGRYIEFCKSTVDKDLSLRGLKIVIDAAHGAGYHVAPDVFHELGAEVVPIGCAARRHSTSMTGVGATAPAGAGGRRGPAPSRLRRGARRRCRPAAAGRCRNGRLYNGDELLYVMVTDRLAKASACRARWAR
jgi:phosphoglucosamine mutase